MLRFLAANLVFIGASVAWGYLGFKIPEATQRATPVWLNGGMNLALYYIWGLRAAPAILIVTLITNIALAGRPLWMALAFGAATLVGVHLATRVLRLTSPQKDGAYDFSELALLIVAAIIMPIINTLVGVTYVFHTQDLSLPDAITVFATWWLGFFLGILLVTPLFLAWWRQRTAARSDVLKFLAVCALSAPILYFIFFTSQGDNAIFGIFPMLLLAARILPRNLFLTYAFLVNASAIGGTVLGFGAFRSGTFGGNLTNLQIFLGTVSVSAVSMEGFRSEKWVRAPIVALLCGWLLSGVIFLVFSETQKREDARQARLIAEDFEPALNARLALYVDNLRVVAALVKDAAPSNIPNVLSFFEQADIARRYPGLEGIDVLFLKLRDWNGLDATLGEKLIEAAASGSPVLTRSLASAPPSQTDLYVPIYARADAKRQVPVIEPMGFIRGDLHLDEFFDAAINRIPRQMSVEIFAGSGPKDPPVFVSKTPPLRPQEDFEFMTTVNLAHYQLTIGWRRSATFRSSRDLSGVILSSTSALMTLFLAGMLANALLLGRRAERLAEEKTKELDAQRAVSAHSAKMASLGEMAGGIAHEINNPLGIIHGTSQMLQRSYKDNKQTKERTLAGLKTIEDTAMRISRIIKGLRTIARSGEEDPFQPERLRTMVEQTLGLCRARFRAESIQLLVDTIPDIALSCRATQISQVLLNLLNNSYDAVKNLEERWVNISFALNPEQIAIMVTDSGKGLPEAVREKIFQPFFTTKEIGRGIGLGLSISQSIADAHHGRLYLDATYPHTRFVLELPLSHLE